MGEELSAISSQQSTKNNSFGLKAENGKLLAILGVAFLIRFLVIPNPGFEADISFWKSWGLATVDFGIVEGLKVSNNNYPTPFAYLLGILVWIYRLFADPHNFNEFWSNTNTLFLAIAKMPSILADFGIAGIILWIGRYGKKLGFPDIPLKNISVVLAALYLLNPVAILDGAWWGQVDSVGVFIFLLSVMALLYKKPFLAGFIYMAAMMTKLQNLIYGPLFFLFAWQYGGFSFLAKSVGGAITGFLGLNIEFVLTKNMHRVLNSLTENYDYFPWMSLNAYNVWWVVAGGKGMEMSDKMLVFGLDNAKRIGLYLFSSSYLLAVLHVIGLGIKRLNMDTPTGRVMLVRRFLEGLIVVAGSFFLFQTQSHDRYAFPVLAFLLLLAPFIVMAKDEVATKRRLFIFSLLYALFSLIYFYNLHTALVINYPHNGLPILSDLTQIPITIAVSLVHIALFGIFIFAIVRKAKLLTWIIPVLGFITVLISNNMPLITKKPMPLTALAPYAYSQQYGQPAKNMSTNSAGDSSHWNPLSVQYAFYRTGIGTHAQSKRSYHIDGLFKTFSFDYGIDTEAGTQATATWEVWGDGKRLFESKKVVRFELPKHADVDISGVNMLDIVTTDAGDGINDDHTDWLNPILYPR
jgi:Gpi18-like mannosyltransferase